MSFVSESSEGMINPENLKGFAAKLENFAQQRINLKLGTTDPDTSPDADDPQVRSFRKVYKKRVDGIGRERMGFNGVRKDKGEDEAARIIWRRASGGDKQVTSQGKIEVTINGPQIHLSLHSPEDYLALCREACRHHVQDLVQDYKSKNGVDFPSESAEQLTELLARTQADSKGAFFATLPVPHSDNLRGVYTAGLESYKGGQNIMAHEGMHLEVNMWREAGMNMGRRPKINAQAVPNNEIDDLLVTAIGGRTLLAEIKGDKHDPLLTEEILATYVGFQGIDQAAPNIPKIGSAYFAEMQSEALIEGSKDLLEAFSKASNQPGLADNILAKLKTQVDNGRTQRLDKAVEVLQKLEKQYGNPEMVVGLLIQFPVRDWPVIVRVLEKYGA